MGAKRRRLYRQDLPRPKNLLGWKRQKGLTGYSGRPNMMKVRLVATFHGQRNVAATTNTNHIMANSAFDPFDTFGAVQGNSWDQWKEMYSLFHVTYASLTITVKNNIENDIYVVLANSRENTAYTNLGRALEQPGAEMRHISASGQAGDTVTIKNFRHSPRGILGSFGNDASCVSTHAANPTTKTWLNIFLQSTGANLTDVDYTIRLTQWVVMSQLRQIEDA